MDVIQEMIQYMEDFLETSYDAFNGMPVCPFAKKARQENHIWYVISNFNLQELLSLANQFLNQQQYEIMLIVNPDKNFSLQETYQVAWELYQLVKDKELIIFGGHQDDPHTVAGFRTRREPYPNIVVQLKSTLETARQQLQRTKYYDNWSKNELAHLNLPTNM